MEPIIPVKTQASPQKPSAQQQQNVMDDGEKGKKAEEDDDKIDVQKVLAAFKLSYKLKLGTFEKCYDAIQMAQGNLEKAVEKLLLE